MCPLYTHSASETSPQKEIRRALAVLYRPSDVAELRAFGKRKTFAGWFDDFEKLATCAAELDSRLSDA